MHTHHIFMKLIVMSNLYEGVRSIALKILLYHGEAQKTNN